MISQKTIRGVVLKPGTFFSTVTFWAVDRPLLHYFCLDAVNQLMTSLFLPRRNESAYD